jgi:hypothetical protein
MPELTFDEASLSRAVQFVMDTGTAAALGEIAGKAFAEGLARLEVNAPPARPPDRDTLAAMAMQGALAADKQGDLDWSPEGVAKWAYSVADAMLAERARRHAVPSPASETTP